MENLGYDDTPFLPGDKWRVHDGERPQPVIVMPSTESSQEQAGQPPSDAVVLFDGTDLSNWEKLDGGDPEWKVENDYMEIVPKTGNIRTKEHFGTIQLHIEWRSPDEIKGESQGRGNSGVFLMGNYEIQVLDCYDNPTYADGLTASIYGQFPPLANANRKPGEWQSYDIFWITPVFDGDDLLSPAYVTIVHNGILVHHHQELMGTTGHRNISGYIPHEPTGPLMLQDHGDLVRFRNIWIRELKDDDEQ